jgi:hypothetical protein
MPSRDKHLELAEHHEAFILHLGSPRPEQFIDWAIAACYWAALNYVDAVLASEDIHPKRDRDRIQVLVEKQRLMDVHRDYRELKYYYEYAMGRGKSYTVTDFELSVLPHLRNIRGRIKRVLDLLEKKGS